MRSDSEMQDQRCASGGARLGGDAGDEEVGYAPAAQPGLQVGVVEGALGALEQSALPLQQRRDSLPETR